MVPATSLPSRTSILQALLFGARETLAFLATLAKQPIKFCKVKRSDWVHFLPDNFEVIQDHSAVAELILLLIILLPVLGVALGMAIPALIQCRRSTFPAPGHKIVWMLMILLVPFFGPILWWVLGMRR